MIFFFDIFCEFNRSTRYDYKRKKFLNMLNKCSLTGKNALELGCGPGGNLKHIYENHSPSELTGADISSKMVELAKGLVPNDVNIIKVDGKTLPFADRKFDVSITATVLQHNTDTEMLKTTIKELCRVTDNSIHIFERVNNPIAGDELCLGRPIEYYSDLFNKHNFELEQTDFINIKISYYVCGAIRKVFNRSSRKEGEPQTALATGLQNMVLPITKVLDRVFTSKEDLVRMTFKRQN